MTISDGSSKDIDEDLHSRQLAVYGRETMWRLFGASVLISGMKGLRAEIAKNLILAGVKSVTLHDEGTVELWDLSDNFLFAKTDVMWTVLLLTALTLCLGNCKESYSRWCQIRNSSW